MKKSPTSQRKSPSTAITRIPNMMATMAMIGSQSILIPFDFYGMVDIRTLSAASAMYLDNNVTNNQCSND